MAPPTEPKSYEGAIQRLSDLLIWLDDPQRRQEIDEFRVKYEKKYGPTDLTKRYTSLFPTDQQNWLIRHYPKRYWDGLPPFAQAYIKQQVEAAQLQGKLDDMPSYLIQLYMKSELDIGGHDRSL